jgi:magnesium and cobalt transporter
LSDDSISPRQKSLLQRIKQLVVGRRRALTEKELQDMILVSEEEGIINEEEGDMLNSIFEFGDTVVREVMIPRTDMVCCSVAASMPDMLREIIRSGHSRFPIYEGSIDQIVGVVYAKDLLRYWGKEPATVSIADVMRAPFFVPESKKIEELLQDFKSRRVHMAIAIDEFGGTSGLITIEDLLEEIVGDIMDEYDLEESQLHEEEDGSLLVDARLNIYELEEHFGLTVPGKDQFDTVGGFLSHLAGHVPKVGEMIRDGRLEMTVVEGDERKISRVKIRLIKPDLNSVPGI